MFRSAGPLALQIIGIATQPFRAGLTFGTGPPGLDDESVAFQASLSKAEGPNNQQI